MLLKLLFRRPGEDPLIPNFTFQHQSPENLESPLFEEIFRLRYEVYCHECGYLDPSEYRDGQESDAYDGRSIHIAGHGLNDGIVGTVRLVLAKSPAEQFTFEEHCRVFDDYKFPPRERCGEISLLVVRKTYRRRAGDSPEAVSRLSLRCLRAGA